MRTATAVATIGVYGFSADTFLAALPREDVRAVIDVRQRRGVRGTEYSWANARRLMGALAEAGVAYRHRRDLAPTTELRQLQYAEDARQRVGKRSRIELAAAYRERYIREILDAADLGTLVAELPTAGVGALLCVERDAQACHRSVIAGRLAAEHRLAVRHIIPRAGSVG